MPNRVEDVKLRTDRVRLGGNELSWRVFRNNSGFWFSGEGDGGIE